MQSTVSTQLLNALTSNGDPQLSGELVRNITKKPLNDELSSFEQLITEQINTQISPPLIDPDGRGQQNIKASLAGNLETLSGKALPHGNLQSAIVQELNRGPLSEQIRAVAGFNDGERITDAKVILGKSIEELLIGTKTPSLARPDAESQTALTASESRFAKHLFAQQYFSNSTNNIHANMAPVGDKVLNQSFMELMESGASLNKLNSQPIIKQGDVSLKTLLSVSSNESSTSQELLRSDSNGTYASTAQNAITKPLLNMTLLPANASAWQQSFGEKVLWMVNKNIHSAEIKLNPPELGRLEVKISMQQHDQTSISFTSQNHQVRELIEAALPRLREMLNDSGLNLSDVEVSDKSSTAKDNRGQFSSDHQSEQSETKSQSLSASEDADETIEQSLVHQLDSSRIDFYV